MPPIETDELNDLAVLWEASGISDNYGGSTVYSPVEIPCRWEQVRREVRDAQGNVVMIEANVVVDQAIRDKSILRLGLLADLAERPDELMIVYFSSHIEDVKGRCVRRRVELMRYGNQLPEIETGTGTY